MKRNIDLREVCAPILLSYTVRGGVERGTADQFLGTSFCATFAPRASYTTSDDLTRAGPFILIRALISRARRSEQDHTAPGTQARRSNTAYRAWPGGSNVARDLPSGGVA